MHPVNEIPDELLVTIAKIWGADIGDYMPWWKLSTEAIWKFVEEMTKCGDAHIWTENNLWNYAIIKNQEVIVEAKNCKFLSVAICTAWIEWKTKNVK